ncbi:MAG: recombination protein NinB [Burkholderia gladioli]
MSEKQHFCLAHAIARKNALRAVSDAPDGYMVEVKPPTRSLEQNAHLWAMLGDVSRQVEWHGQYLGAEDWKHIFSASLRKQRVAPGLDGGFVVLGQSTSRMTIREMSDLIELMHAFGAERNVRWSEPDQGWGELCQRA